jgi:5'-phosphate synthase pdxT subunit
MKKSVGVLALQGDFDRHMKKLAACGAMGVEVRDLETLFSTDALIIPGGESTTLLKFFDTGGWWGPLEAWARGHPVMGTCAGAIVMAETVMGPYQPSLGLLPIAVERNAYGRQVDSFATNIREHTLGGESLPAFFIRAPKIREVGEGVEVLARLNGDPVMVRRGHFLALTFHPELTEDERIHRHFLNAIINP